MPPALDSNCHHSCRRLQCEICGTHLSFAELGDEELEELFYGQREVGSVASEALLCPWIENAYDAVGGLHIVMDHAEAVRPRRDQLCHRYVQSEEHLRRNAEHVVIPQSIWRQLRSGPRLLEVRAKGMKQIAGLPKDEIPECLISYVDAGEHPMGKAKGKRIPCGYREPKCAQFAPEPAQSADEPVQFGRPLAVTEGENPVDQSLRTKAAVDKMVAKLQGQREPQVRLTTGSALLEQDVAPAMPLMSHVRPFFPHQSR
eukprot:gene3968-biopygen9135